MNWSFQIATVAGIPIRVHLTFVVVLWLGGYQWGSVTGTPVGVIFGVALMLLLFGCVTLHELGHGLVARAFGIAVREIVLFPFGGMAYISHHPEQPGHELLIALAGPLVNVALALGLLVPLGFSLGPLWLSGPSLVPAILGTTPSLTTALGWLLAANVSLAVFNLLPALPLDGGRGLRALLTLGVGYATATRLTVQVSRLLGLGLGAAGLLTDDWLLLLAAAFIFFAAGQETAAAEAKTVLDSLRVGDAYNKHALTLAVGERVSQVVDYIRTSYQADFAVLQAQHLLGIVTRRDVLTTLASAPDDRLVTEMMQRTFLKVDVSKSLTEVRAAMEDQGTRVAAIYAGATYVGLIGLEDIAEAFALQTFVRRHARLKPAPRRQ